MINFYISRIKKGKITINSVPERWREIVKETLKTQ